MKQHSVPKFLDNFLTRTLSGTVFSWREILHLTFPNVLDCLSIMFISMLITALISSNGEASVAAVSLVTPLAWMITCIFNGISAGGTVVVAQSCGMKDPVRIRKAAGMTHLLELRRWGEAKEVLVIGDDMNDLPMIRHFNGHAVANAAPEVRDAASSVFLSVGQMLRERV